MFLHRRPSAALLHDAEDSVFAFAGIWDSWRGPEGHNVETFSIITTRPNRLLASVHDRMSVILPEDV